MSASNWQWQVRINLSDEFAQIARRDASDPVLAPVTDILKKYNAVLKNQFDAFADFCADAEAANDTDTPLYLWTKDLVDNPAKEAQYANRFSIYADGGQEVYSQASADGLEAELTALIGQGMVTKVNKFDSNPANNPQAPKKFHK